MAERKTSVAVWGALAANAGIAVTKFIVAAISGSSAMLSEGIHSVVDTGNEVLLLIGEKRARRAPDASHPYGYGKEIYFFTLLVGVLLFGIGGGMSLYEGIEHLQHPRHIADATWNFVVLGVAFVFELASWILGRRELLRGKSKGTLAALRETKDAPSMSVVAEDSAALVGLVVAAIGVSLNRFAHLIIADALASIAIGVLLCGVASFLVWQTRALLVGEAASPDVVDAIRRAAKRESSIRCVRRVLTMHLGPHQILLDLEVEFEGDVEIPCAIERLESAIRNEVPDARPIFVEAR
jgi:cation diffusion facilitator family transporter